MKTKEFFEVEMAALSDAITFNDVKRLKAIEDAQNEASDLLTILSILIDRIIETVEPEIRMNKIAEAINEYLELIRPLVEARNNSDIIEERDSVKSIFEKYDVPAAESQKLESGNGIVVWKEKSSGSYRWFTVYSNKFLDEDNPPEIISGKSQQAFVEMVDKEIVPYPELWLWHVDGSRIGVADMVDYADGFAVASGIFDPGMENVAKNLSQMDDLLVSHGMYSHLLRRDPEQNHIITFHVTKEISPLPSEAAANKRTGFKVLQKGRDMSDSQKGLAPQKKQFLQDSGLDQAIVEGIEKLMKETEQEAVDSGVPSKEQSVDESEQDSEVETMLGREEVANALAAVVKPIIESTQALTARVAELESSVKSLAESDEKKIAKLKEETPAESLNSLLENLLMGNSTIDEDSEQAKLQPKETSTVNGSTGIPFLDSLISGGE